MCVRGGEKRKKRGGSASCSYALSSPTYSSFSDSRCFAAAASSSLPPLGASYHHKVIISSLVLVRFNIL